MAAIATAVMQRKATVDQLPRQYRRRFQNRNINNQVTQVTIFRRFMIWFRGQSAAY